MARTFFELEVWKVAEEVNDEVWRLKARIRAASPGTWHQLDRSAESVMDNIAEGFGRESRRDFANYLRYVRRSAAEAQSQIARSRRRKLVSDGEAKPVIAKLDHVSAMAKGLQRYLERNPAPP